MFANHLAHTARVINIDPLVSGKHIGASEWIEAGSQHHHETTAEACSGYRFNNYEYRCITITTGAEAGFLAGRSRGPHRSQGLQHLPVYSLHSSTSFGTSRSSET